MALGQARQQCRERGEEGIAKVAVNPRRWSRCGPSECVGHPQQLVDQALGVLPGGRLGFVGVASLQ